MTDNPDKVHPVIHAVAAAMHSFEHGGSHGLASEPEECRQYWYGHAKAAAKVLLSMEPTDEMLEAAMIPASSLDPGVTEADARWLFGRMTAAARSDMGV